MSASNSPDIGGDWAEIITTQLPGSRAVRQPDGVIVIDYLGGNQVPSQLVFSPDSDFLPAVIGSAGE